MKHIVCISIIILMLQACARTAVCRNNLASSISSIRLTDDLSLTYYNWVTSRETVMLYVDQRSSGGNTLLKIEVVDDVAKTCAVLFDGDLSVNLLNRHRPERLLSLGDYDPGRHYIKVNITVIQPGKRTAINTYIAFNVIDDVNVFARNRGGVCTNSSEMQMLLNSVQFILSEYPELKDSEVADSVWGLSVMLDDCWDEIVGTFFSRHSVLLNTNAVAHCVLFLKCAVVSNGAELAVGTIPLLFWKEGSKWNTLPVPPGQPIVALASRSSIYESLRDNRKFSIRIYWDRDYSMRCPTEGYLVQWDGVIVNDALIIAPFEGVGR